MGASQLGAGVEGEGRTGSGDGAFSLKSTPVKSPPRKIQRVCAECRNVYEDDQDVLLSSPRSVGTPVRSPFAKCPKCGPSPSHVADTGGVGCSVEGLPAAAAWPFASGVADEAELDAGVLGSDDVGAGFAFGALSPAELWASQDFLGEVAGGEVSGVDVTCVLPEASGVGREAASACQWPASERGFVNGGNQCYMIAAVQLLGSAMEFRASLQHVPVAQGGAMLRAMQADFNDVLGRGNNVPRCSLAGRCEQFRNFGISICFSKFAFLFEVLVTQAHLCICVLSTCICAKLQVFHDIGSQR